MTSAVQEPPFSFAEMRPDTSKCSRGNKFNKTMTGFHSIADAPSLEKPAAASQVAIMNGTGFNFRSNAATRQPHPPPQPPQGSIVSTEFAQQQQHPAPPAKNVFSSTSQGFYDAQAKSNSFSKGMTLDQYFNFQKDAVPASLIAAADPTLDQAPSEKHQQLNNIPSVTPESKPIRSDDIPRTHLRNSSRGSSNKKSTGLKEQQQQSQTNGQQGQHEEDTYFQEDFEIHEETEEEDDDDEMKNEFQSKRMHRSKHSQVSAASRSAKRPQPQQNLQHSAFKSTGSMNSEDIDFDRTSTDQTTMAAAAVAATSSRRQTKRRTSRDPTADTFHHSQQQQTGADHRSASIDEIGNSEESHIQIRIRDKYFKKTLHNRPFLNNQSIGGAAKKQSHQQQQQMNTQSPPISPQKQQKTQITNPQILSGSNADNLPFKTSSNFNNIPKPSNSMGVTQKQSNQIASQTGQNFYAQQQSQTSQQQQQYQQTDNQRQSSRIQENNNSKSPTPFGGQTGTASRKGNRSQSPLNNFKRTQNMIGHSHQRQLSREMMTMISAMDIDDDSQNQSRMRATFMNTSSNNNNNNSFVSHSKQPAKSKQQQPSQQQQQMGTSVIGQNQNQNGTTNSQHHHHAHHYTGEFENHITFRTSFYSKAGGVIGAGQQTSVAAASQIASNNNNNNSYNQNSKLRLTVNEFYKNPNKQQQGQQASHQQSQKESYESTQMLRGQPDYLSQDAMAMMMRRTAKENKFLNQKDKIQEMAFQDASYITKHAARFNINPSEFFAFVPSTMESTLLHQYALTQNYFIIYNALQNSAFEVEKTQEIIPQPATFDRNQLFNFEIETNQNLSPTIKSLDRTILGYFRLVRMRSSDSNSKEYVFQSSTGFISSKSTKTLFAVTFNEQGFAGIAIYKDRNISPIIQRNSGYQVQVSLPSQQTFQWIFLVKLAKEFNEKTLFISNKSNLNRVLTSISDGRNTVVGIQKNAEQPIGLKGICKSDKYRLRECRSNRYLSFEENGIFNQLSKRTTTWTIMKNVVNSTYYLASFKTSECLAIKVDASQLCFEIPNLMSPEQQLNIIANEGNEMDIDDEEEDMSPKDKPNIQMMMQVRFKSENEIRIP